MRWFNTSSKEMSKDALVNLMVKLGICYKPDPNAAKRKVYTFQPRRDVSTEWTRHNPVLANGETAIETDTRKFKVGNGRSRYLKLQYDQELYPATLLGRPLGIAL